MIHTREAWDDTFAILAAEGVPERTVFHCFTGGPDEARRVPRPRRPPVVQRHRHFKGADDVRAAAALCPLDRLLVETDSPVPRARCRTGASPTARRCVPLVGRRRWPRREGVAVDEVEAATTGQRRAASSAWPPSRDLSPDARSPTCSTRHGLRPSRALGQNFVVDPNTVRRIARLAGVGPGRPGGRDRRRARLAHPGPGRDRRGGHRGRGRPRTWCRCCARSSSRPGVTVVEGDALAPRLGGAARRRARGRSSPTSRTTWPRRSCSTCSTACRPSRAMLVMVQREVGERLAAGRGRRRLRHPVGEGGLLGHGRGGRAGAGHACSCPAQGRVGAGARSSAGRRRPWTPPTRRRLFALVRAGLRPAPQDAAPLAGRAWSTGRGLRLRRRPPRGPGRGARRRRTGAGWPACNAVTGVGQAHPRRCASPACGPTATTCSTPRWSRSTWPTS